MSSFLTVLDTLKTSQGCRFGKTWKDLEISDHKLGTTCRSCHASDQIESNVDSFCRSDSKRAASCGQSSLAL